MRSLKFKEPTPEASSWAIAVYLTGSYLAGNAKADQLLHKLPTTLTGKKRATAQSLFYGALRHGHLIRQILNKLCKKPPQPELKAIFLVTGYELLSADGERVPQIIHHAVQQSKKLIPKAQTGFLNAVLRKIPGTLAAIPADDLATKYSHPEWLVTRWLKEFSPEVVPKLLEWNQQEPQNYLKIHAGTTAADSIGAFTQATPWDHFYSLAPEAVWMRDVQPLLDSGAIYLKDPSTRLAPNLLAPKAGESVLDLCAAPGGKAFDLANQMDRKGLIVAVDLPGKRIPTLKENLEKLTSNELKTAIVQKDILALKVADFESNELPATYDAVMLDAPCSNTGVIQRRTDVKWRLSEDAIDSCATLQQELLQAASRFVRPGGRIVYSTCSIEAAENTQVVDHFLQSPEGAAFNLKASETSYPWERNHDGAGAFLLTRAS
ncbi:MAG: transcription antitermination factor NusB [Verrucomicrobiota bacterium]